MPERGQPTIKTGDFIELEVTIDSITWGVEVTSLQPWAACIPHSLDDNLTPHNESKRECL